MAFRTQYDQPVRVHSEPGSGEKILYAPVFDKNGVMSLVESGKEDFYGYIQSFKDSCDIHLILQRYAQGDMTVLSKRQGMYGDFTEMPHTYAEALNAISHAENYFMTLPVETRAEFGHDFRRFLASMDQPGFAETIGLVPKAGAQDPEPSGSGEPASSPAQPAQNAE